jgi:cell division protein FtsB
VLKRNRKKASPILTWGTVAAVALALFAVFGDQGLLRLRHMNRIELRLEEQIVGLRGENEHLSHSIASLDDPSSLEKVVREELGYLGDNEVIFYIGEKNP